MSTPSMLNPSESHVLQVIIDETGLGSLRDRVSDFQSALHQRMQDLSLVRFSDYLNRFESEQYQRSELKYFTEALTISETYFFRHPEVVEAFRAQVDDAVQRGQVSHLRIWSAACSIGCEPYTLGILLHDLMQKYPHLQGRIYASDINAQSLRTARAARYSKWSLRNLAPNDVEQYFTHSGSQFVLRPLYQDHITFFQHNLMAGPPASVLGDSGSLDAIFCRNVLIYFDAETTSRLIRMFFDLLRPGGWLVLGPSESNSLIVSGFDVIQRPNAVLYRKPDRSTQNRGADAYQPVQLSRSMLPRKGRTKTETPAERARVTKVACPANEVRELIRSGSYTKAYKTVSQQVQLHELEAAWHLLAAFLAQKLRRVEDADSHYRRAIYLDRKSVAAHYLYAAFLVERQVDAKAQKECEVALKLLSLAAEEVIELPAETLSVLELKQRIQKLNQLVNESR